ncbi:hypothetical protein [Microvirga massiliensis]|uniref:hypothetical protein n=1 Tax=Microvirga massiliensis TaxID=1033741 RepID=UPI000AAF9686|nr:hypothetical protein [Microvirga massiliensis]
MAGQLLANTTPSFGQVAAVLDYPEVSTFTSGFRCRTDQALKAWRAEPSPWHRPWPKLSRHCPYRSSAALLAE